MNDSSSSKQPLFRSSESPEPVGKAAGDGPVALNPLEVAEEATVSPPSEDPDTILRARAISQSERQAAQAAAAAMVEEEDEVVSEMPIYLSSSLAPPQSLYLMQFPTHPALRPISVPQSAAQRGAQINSRLRPKARHFEMEVPLDTRPAVYNAEKGEEMGAGAEATTTGRSRSKKGDGGGAKRLEKMRMESQEMPSQTKYMVGVIKDYALHLTPLSTALQLRPSLHYLDRLTERARAEKRRERMEEEDDEDDEDVEDEGPGGQKGKGKGKQEGKAIQVSIRGSDPNAPGRPGAPGAAQGNGLMAALRAAEAERWIDMEWVPEESGEATDVFERQLFAERRDDLRWKPTPFLLSPDRAPSSQPPLRP